MSHLRYISALVCAITMCSLAAPGQVQAADGFLGKLVGKWRGKGTIETLGEAPNKEPLACRLTASLVTTGALELTGRCGSVSVTSSFQTSLKTAADGTISGKPILQRGKLADVTLSGKAGANSLKLRGTEKDDTLETTFILTGEAGFQTQSSHLAAGAPKGNVVINWTRQ